MFIGLRPLKNALNGVVGCIGRSPPQLLLHTTMLSSLSYRTWRTPAVHELQVAPTRCVCIRKARHSQAICQTRLDAMQDTCAAHERTLQMYLRTLGKVVTSCTLSALLLVGDASAAPGSAELSPNTRLLDLARVVPAAQFDKLDDRVLEVERKAGWRVRLLTKYREDQGPSVEELRAAWKPDQRTVVMLVDTSSPNIMQFRYGDGVLTQLRRPFFIELQSRYGNQFYVRDEGESAAVVNALSTLLDCIERDGGCAVVPGIPQDQYYLTLACAVAGGFVFGFASLLEPQGFVQRKWVWLLLFAPLWFTLAVNFGIGPIVSRTSEPIYVISNAAGFAAAAGLVRLSPMFRSQT